MTLPAAAYLKISSSRPAKGRHGSAAEYPAWANLTLNRFRRHAGCKVRPRAGCDGHVVNDSVMAGHPKALADGPGRDGKCP